MGLLAGMAVVFDTEGAEERLEIETEMSSWGRGMLWAQCSMSCSYILSVSPLLSPLFSYL